METGLADSLEVLELRERDITDLRRELGDALSGDLHEQRLPRLRVLILQGAGEHPTECERCSFWTRHPLLERVEMHYWEDPSWFKGFAPGMLPNLTTLKVFYLHFRR